MKHTIKIAAALVGTLLALSSCIEETFPTEYTTDDQLSGTEEGLESQVNGLNAWLVKFNSLGYEYNEEEHFDFGYPGLCLFYEALGQDMACRYTGYDALYFVRNFSSMSPEGLTSWFPWQYLYTQIYLANSILKGVDAENPTDRQKAYIGQALVFRAMAYFDLARLYCYRGTQTGRFVGLSVPIIREHTTQAEAENNPRASEDDLYDQLIIPDLKQAAELLDGYVRPAKTYADKAVAEGLLARVYLQREMWAEAAQTARKAIDDSGCSPLSKAQYTDSATGFNSLASQNSWLWGASMNSESEAVQTGICNFTSFAANENLFGYAFVNYAPKQIDARLYASIPDTDFRKQLFVDPAGKIPILSNFVYLDYMPDYASVKFRPGRGNIEDALIASATDFPILRVEELLLIEAEAEGMRDASRGRQLLEAFVRTHRDPAYTCNAATSAEVQDAVFQQRRIEFWGEGITPFDFKRLAKPIVRGYEGTDHGTGFCYNSPTGPAPWLTLSIPRKEMDNNKGITDADNNPNATLLRGTLWTSGN